jgi:hypothetical protein
MPAKSRRNRRNFPQGPKTTINRSVAGAAGVSPVETARPERTVNAYNTAARATASPEISYPYFLREIKWITLVTVIVAIILVILYIFLH